jgi:hypothetical protein
VYTLLANCSCTALHNWAGMQQVHALTCPRQYVTCAP